AGVACFAGWLWITNARKVTRARFEQVKTGMSREEVIRTVGGLPSPNPLGWDYWVGDDADLLVRFNDADKAIIVTVLDSDANRLFVPRPTLTERIRRWLGL